MSRLASIFKQHIQLLYYFYSSIKQIQMDQQESSRLQKLWQQNMERQIEGTKHTFKIDRNQFLGRGGFGIVFGGICRINGKIQQTNNTYTEVAIKQFKKSQKWRKEEQKDKQLLLLGKYGILLNPQYVLEVIDIFQDKQSLRYFMVTPLARGGNLSQKISTIKDQEEIFTFCMRMAEILKYIHYDALSSYKSKVGGEGEKLKIAIIHRDVKPQNIVYLKKEDIKSLYLLDFGIAKIGYSDLQKGYNNCGTSFYKAAQIGQGRIYNANVDIYGFACTLYEMLNDGERLLTSTGLGTKYGDRQRFIKGRLVDLQLKLTKNKIAHSYYWIDLLQNCLAYETKKRFSSQQLLKFLQGNHFSLLSGQNLNKLALEIGQRQKSHREKRQTFQLNFQIFRLNMIQNTIYTIFQYIYFDQPRINKFLLYTLLKFITMTFIDRFNKTKYKCREKIQKYNQLKNMIQQKKITELREKSSIKIKKEIQKQENNNKIQNKKGFGPIHDIIKRYPQILHEKAADPKRTLSEFCYQKKSQILQNQKFAKYILTIISYLQDIDYYPQLQLQSAELDNNQIELLTVRKLNYFSRYIQDRLSKEYLKTKLENCRVEGTLKSNINKQENKTDIEIQRVE